MRKPGQQRMEFDLDIGGRIDIHAVRYSGPTLAELDEQGRRLYFRACDLVARGWLNDQSDQQFEAGVKDCVASLVHAERYLADRLAYELAPWPKGMVRLEPDDAYRLPDRVTA